MNKEFNSMLRESAKPTGLQEDKSRLSIIDKTNFHINKVSSALENDNVILIRDISFEKAEEMLKQIASHYELLESLKLQSTFASIAGQRKNVGKYHMTVNERKDYEYVTPHSEGDSFSNMQLASFYCSHNTTDGGENILLNVDSDSRAWETLKECTMKLRVNDFDKNKLTKQHIAFARALFQINLPEDLLSEIDKIVSEVNIEDMQIEDMEMNEDLDIQLFNVLSKTKKSYSKILKKDVYPYWESVSGYDSSSGTEYQNMLENDQLLRRPDGDSHSQLDTNATRWKWSSDVPFSEIFRSKITIRLSPGEFIIMNNLTWAHSTTNWNPNSGIRNLVAAFA